MEKFSKLVNGNTIPLDKVGSQKTPVLTMAGASPKLVCQFTGLLCDTVWAAREGKKFSGYVADETLAREILVSMGASEPPKVVSFCAEDVLESETKKKRMASKKKELNYFKVQGTNIEKFHCVDEWAYLAKLTPGGFFTYLWDGVRLFSLLPVKKDKFQDAMAYSGNGEQLKKVPKLPDGLIVCTNQTASTLPRLQMLLNEHKGVMPIGKRTMQKMKGKIDEENAAEKFKHKHCNSKLKNVDRLPFRTPKRLRDIANPPAAAPVAKRAKGKGLGKVSEPSATPAVPAAGPAKRRAPRRPRLKSGTASSCEAKKASSVSSGATSKKADATASSSVGSPAGEEEYSLDVPVPGCGSL